MRTEILECLTEGLSLRSTASCCGVGTAFIASWAKDDPTFGSQLKKATSDGERALLGNVRAGVQSWQSSAWMLSRRFPDRWGKKREEHKPVAAVQQFGREDLEAMTKASEELRKK
jgi:hypothetical protein